MLKKFLQIIRRCPGCGSSLNQVEWLCLNCLATLVPKIHLKSRQISPNISHYYLLDWVEGDGLTPLVHSLKGGHCHWAYRFLANYLHAKEKKVRGPLFYPSKGKKDHAFQLANSFSKNRDCEIQPVQKVSALKQSLLTRKARGRVLYTSSKKVKFHGHFVDDIVTTGATVEACYKAIGQPRKMTVWSVFYRKYL